MLGSRDLKPMASEMLSNRSSAKHARSNAYAIQIGVNCQSLGGEARQLLSEKLTPGRQQFRHVRPLMRYIAPDLWVIAGWHGPWNNGGEALRSLSGGDH